MRLIPSLRCPLAIALLAGVACDDAPGPLDGPLAHEAPLAAPLDPTPVVGGPSQITVDDTQQLDPLDPTVLHVPVPAGQEAVALARAADLLAVADPSALPQPTMAAHLAAQRIAAEIAEADMVATADVTSVTPHVAPDGSPTDLAQVVFSTDLLVSGTTAQTWTSRLMQESSCPPVAPAVGERVLVFLDDAADSVQLRRGAPVVPVVGDTVVLHGLTLDVDDIATVVAQNPEAP